jgi:hypothetical protein
MNLILLHNHSRAGLCGSEARFLNHSCDPNCEIEKWNVLGEWRVGIFAKHPIAAGQELTYDYNFEAFASAKVTMPTHFLTMPTHFF